MNHEAEKYTVVFAEVDTDPRVFEKASIQIGRLEACEVVLDHKSVSRIHATIIYRHSKYFLINLSSSNILTVNGRRIQPKRNDVLADGDIIQIGPFAILVTKPEIGVTLTVRLPVKDSIASEPLKDQKPNVGRTSAKTTGVLNVFWDKRTRDEKDNWGSRLRPKERPKPGKAAFNWKPTYDLQLPWRFTLFIWAFAIIGVFGAFAYLRYPEVYALKPLSNPHSSRIDGSTIANASNSSSCTTCHRLNEPIENSCNSCHQAEEFHMSNTNAHEQSGVTCTVCHREHQGADFQLAASALEACSTCHNDNNSTLYNGKSVRTAHGGSYGYPVLDGTWKWKGVYFEVAEGVPGITNAATGDKDDQERLSRHFHAIHLGRLKAPTGLAHDKRGLVSCSSCHKSQDPIDRATPSQTCAVCHTTPATAAALENSIGQGTANCISCHVQHPYSTRRWSEFLSEDALLKRNDAVARQIKQLKGK